MLPAIVAESFARSDFPSAVSREESRRLSAACQFASKRLSRATRAGETGISVGRRGLIGIARTPAASAAAARGTVRVIPRERCPVERVSLHDHAHFALRRGKQRLEITWDRVLRERPPGSDRAGQDDDKRQERRNSSGRGQDGELLKR